MMGHRKFKNVDSGNEREALLIKTKRAIPIEFENQGLIFKREPSSIENDRAAIDKDWRLVVAALNSERLITSLDDNMRTLLVIASRKVSDLGLLSG